MYVLRTGKYIFAMQRMIIGQLHAIKIIMLACELNHAACQHGYVACWHR